MRSYDATKLMRMVRGRQDAGAKIRVWNLWTRGDWTIVLFHETRRPTRRESTTEGT